MPSVTKNAKELKFYLRFLVLTGAREQEALKVRWQDVDLRSQQVTIGADGDTKNSRHRAVNFTPELKCLTCTRWPKTDRQIVLFCSRVRNEAEQDIPAKSLRESFKLARLKAGLPWVGFHDFRHLFASICVMRLHRLRNRCTLARA